VTQAADNAAAETNKDETTRQNLPTKDLNMNTAFGGVQTHEYPWGVYLVAARNNLVLGPGRLPGMNASFELS
jgi:hypothetical protein